MNYNKDATAELFNNCKDSLPQFTMPKWENLPSIDLYMDQVIEIVNSSFDSMRSIFPNSPEVTRPMINNYVKLKIMPAPEKKKYSRKHLAYILIICTLKQSLNISAIQNILPSNLCEEEVHYVYDSFVRNQQKALKYVFGQLEISAKPALTNEDANPELVDNFILQLASAANILKCLSEKIIAPKKSE